jgi:hypothetical protein
MALTQHGQLAPDADGRGLQLFDGGTLETDPGVLVGVEKNGAA